MDVNLHLSRAEHQSFDSVWNPNRVIIQHGNEPGVAHNVRCFADGEWVSEQLLTEEVEEWFPEGAVVLPS